MLNKRSYIIIGNDDDIMNIKDLSNNEHKLN